MSTLFKTVESSLPDLFILLSKLTSPYYIPPWHLCVKRVGEPFETNVNLCEFSINSALIFS